MFFILLAVFIGIPVAEIAILIETGSRIGVLPTIGLILLTAVAGTIMLRMQGLKVLYEAQNTMAQNGLPVDAVIHGVFLLVAGAFLLTPGFITDGLGFLLLVPAFRLGIAKFLWQRVQSSGSFRVYGVDGMAGGSEEENIIEGEFEITGKPQSGNNKTSPWLKDE